MKRVGLLGILLMLVMGLTFIPAQTTYAQEEGCVDYLDGEGENGWEIVDFGAPIAGTFGTYNSGDDRYEAAFNPTGEGYFQRISLELEEPTTVASVAITVDYDSTLTTIEPFFAAGLDYDGVNVEGWAVFPSPVSNSADVLTYVIPTEVESEISIISTAYGDVSTGHSYITAITICFGDAPGGLTRPLAAADEDPDWGIFDWDYIHQQNSAYTSYYEVQAHSAVFGAPVTAIAPGVVISVTPYTPDDCQAAIHVSTLLSFRLGSFRWCSVVIPGQLDGSGIHQTYSVEMVNNYRVVVQDAINPDITYEYIITNPTVQEGDEVVAGCIIGQTIQLKQLQLGIINAIISIIGNIFGVTGSATPLSNPTEAGVAFVSMFENSEEGAERVSLYPSLIQQPDLSNCSEKELSGCSNDDPGLSRLDRYYYDSGVTLISGGGATLPVDKRLYQTEIMIDPLLTYTLSVQARIVSVGGDDELGKLRLVIGQGLGVQTANFDTTGGWTNYSLTTTGTEWVYNTNLTDIGVYNGGSFTLRSDIEIRYMCLAPVTASTAPGSCYFANNEFDYDATGWTINNTTFASGQAFMLDGSSIIQNDVRLLPDDESTPHNYTIRAVARLLATSAYTGQVGKEVVLQYEYPQGDTPTDVGVIDSAAVVANGLSPVTGAVLLEYPYVLTVNLEITEEMQEDFLFRVEVTDPDNYILGLRLDSVCIDPEGDGTFPGQDPGGGYDPPVIRGCSVVPVPIEGSVAAWTFYHWSNLKRFFNCELMPLLKNWFKIFDDFRRTMLGVARYWIAVVRHVSNWVGSVFLWLDGSFRNMIGGQVTTIIDGGGCHDIFCAIVDVVTTLANLLNPVVAALNNVVNVLLGVLVGTVNLFFTIIGGLVAFVVALIIKLLSLFQLAGSLLTTIITAFNSASPASIPGLPMCSIDPDSSQLCAMVWVTDNTVFSGRWGILWAVFLSICAIHMIIWAIGELKDILLKTWGSS